MPKQNQDSDKLQNAELDRTPSSLTSKLGGFFRNLFGSRQKSSTPTLKTNTIGSNADLLGSATEKSQQEATNRTETIELQEQGQPKRPPRQKRPAPLSPIPGVSESQQALRTATQQQPERPPRKKSPATPPRSSSLTEQSIPKLTEDKSPLTPVRTAPQPPTSSISESQKKSPPPLPPKPSAATVIEARQLLRQGAAPLPPTRSSSLTELSTPKLMANEAQPTPVRTAPQPPVVAPIVESNLTKESQIRSAITESRNSTESQQQPVRPARKKPAAPPRSSSLTEQSRSTAPQPTPVRAAPPPPATPIVASQQQPSATGANNIPTPPPPPPAMPQMTPQRAESDNSRRALIESIKKVDLSQLKQVNSDTTSVGKSTDSQTDLMQQIRDFGGSSAAKLKKVEQISSTKSKEPAPLQDSLAQSALLEKVSAELQSELSEKVSEKQSEKMDEPEYDSWSDEEEESRSYNDDQPQQQSQKSSIISSSEAAPIVASKRQPSSATGVRIPTPPPAMPERTSQKSPEITRSKQQFANSAKPLPAMKSSSLTEKSPKTPETDRLQLKSTATTPPPSPPIVPKNTQMSPQTAYKDSRSNLLESIQNFKKTELKSANDVRTDVRTIETNNKPGLEETMANALAQRRQQKIGKNPAKETKLQSGIVVHKDENLTQTDPSGPRDKEIKATKLQKRVRFADEVEAALKKLEQSGNDSGFESGNESDKSSKNSAETRWRDNVTKNQTVSTDKQGLSR